jgi:hypothetical protein
MNVSVLISTSLAATAFYLAAALLLVRAVSAWRRRIPPRLESGRPLPAGLADDPLALGARFRPLLVDYIVGDDWRVAAVIGAALLASWGLIEAGIPAWWLLPLAVVASAAQSLHRAVRRERG